MSQVLAERLHAAFVESSGWTDAPAFLDWPDKGSAWFALANCREGLLEAPEQREPYTLDLRTPIAKRFTGDVEIMETLPTSLRIRPRVAGDLCLVECATGGQAYASAIQARINGVSVSLLEDRVDPVDVELGSYLIASATGADAAMELRERAGELMPEVPGHVLEDVEVWQAVAHAMLVTDEGDRAKIACRTPGLGTLDVGPYRVRHRRIWEDVGRDSNEWAGRQAALADMSGKTLGEINSARVEDIARAWSAFEVLKKNATEVAMSLFLDLHFSKSTGGTLGTSTTGPTPD